MVFVLFMKGYVLVRLLVADQAIRSPEHDNKPFSLAGVLIEAGGVSVKIIQWEFLGGMYLKAEKQQAQQDSRYGVMIFIHRRFSKLSL